MNEWLLLVVSLICESITQRNMFNYNTRIVHFLMEMWVVLEVSRYGLTASLRGSFHLFYHLLGENCKSDLLEKETYKELHDFWCQVWSINGAGRVTCWSSIFCVRGLLLNAKYMHGCLGKHCLLVWNHLRSWCYSFSLFSDAW